MYTRQRRVWVLMAVAIGVVLSGRVGVASVRDERREHRSTTVAGAAARRQSPPAREGGGEITFSGSTAPDGGYVLTVESPVVRLQKTTYLDRVVLELATPDGKDRVRIIATQASVSVGRGRSRVALDPRTVDQAAVDRARGLLLTSNAVRGVRALVAELERWESSPAVDSTLVSGALVGLLDGDLGAVSRVARRLGQRRERRIQQAGLQQTPTWCWSWYSYEVTLAMADMEECVGNAGWWNIGQQYACRFVWIIRAELAWFWLISCSGGVPML